MAPRNKFKAKLKHPGWKKRAHVEQDSYAQNTKGNNTTLLMKTTSGPNSAQKVSQPDKAADDMERMQKWSKEGIHPEKIPSREVRGMKQYVTLH